MKFLVNGCNDERLRTLERIRSNALEKEGKRSKEVSVTKTNEKLKL
jgi:hypothetical protein